MGHSRADSEELGGDSDGDAAAVALMEDDRPGHGGEEKVCFWVR